MAALAITLTGYSEEKNRREYTLSGDTLLLPKRVIQFRTPAGGNKQVAEFRTIVSHGCVDSVTSEVLPEKIMVETRYRMPIKASAASITAATSDSQNVLISDEFAATYQVLGWVDG